MELTAEEKKLVRGFVFLSQKPILYVLNISRAQRWRGRGGAVPNMG